MMTIPFWPLLGVGAVAGIFMGLFGIGGGAIMVPAMVLLLGLDQKFASGTSLAAQVLPIGLLGATVYYRNGNMDIKGALVLAGGLAVGGLVGAMFVNQAFVSSEMMKKVFGVFLIGVGVRYLVMK